MKRFGETGFWYAALVAVWPLLFFHAYLYSGSSIAISNDFTVLYYVYKEYLLGMLSDGHFPLWSPAEGAGYPFYSNPFTQAFYPLNIPLVLYYKVMGGYTVYDHQVFAVLGVSIYALGLYFWLNQLATNRRAVLFAVLLISVSFKMGELLRFPNAAHAAAWMPWILYGITRARFNPGSGRTALILFGACIMQLTAGYPYFSYYCLFLVPPYFLLLCFKTTREAVVDQRALPAVSLKRYALTVASPAILAGIICAPYLLKVRMLMAQTVGRGGGHYDYATNESFNALDTLGSFFFPPAAQAEGWYYFGMLGVLLLSAYVFAVLYHKPYSRREQIFVLCAAVWFVLITLITYGNHSYLFNLLYRIMPGFDNLRVWGRLNIVLVPVFAVLLCRAFMWFESLLAAGGEEKSKWRSVLVVVSITAVIAMVLQGWLVSTERYDLIYYFFVYRHGTEWRFLTLTLLALLIFILVMRMSLRGLTGSRRALLSITLLFAGAGALDIWLSGGAEQWRKLNVDGTARARAHYLDQFKDSFSSPRTRSYFTLELPKFNTGWLQYWYFSRYFALDQRVYDGVHKVADAEELPYYEQLMGIEGGKKIFVSESIDHETIRDFVTDAENLEASTTVVVELKEYDGDTLLFEIETPIPVYVSFIDNWDPDWRAEVNGEPVPIELLFGTFKSVRVGAGSSTVRFSYRPYAGFFDG